MNSTNKFFILVFGAFLSLPPPVSAADHLSVTATIHTDQVTGQIDEKIYGQFLEHIYHSVNGGLWGEVVWNRSFEETAGRGACVVTNGCLQMTARQEEFRVPLGDLTWRDYECTFAAQKLSGSEGLLIGIRGDRRRFVLLLGAESNRSFRMELDTPVPHRREVQQSLLKTMPGQLETGRWYQVRVRCEGPRVQAWLDGRSLFDVTDSTGPVAGALTLGCLNATVQLRDIKVVQLPDDRVLFNGVPSPARHWQVIGAADVVQDSNQPLNGKTCLRWSSRSGEAGVAQEHFALHKGDRLSGSLWLRGQAAKGVSVRLLDGKHVLQAKTLPSPTADWQEFPLAFDVNESVSDATLQVVTPGEATVWVDQVSLMPDSARATGGFRPDLLAAVEALRVPLIRWPGGSFVNNYQWKNGIGPQRDRIGKSGWDDYDPLSVGIDEFMVLCRQLGAEPLIPVNVTTALNDPELLQDALDLMEYCNGPADSKWGKVRVGNGHPEPYQVRYWEIGNENWGLGPTNYAKIVQMFVPAMKKQYPAIKIAICGSGGLAPDGGYGQSWNTCVITNCGALADFISLHFYENPVNYAEPGRFQTFWRETAQCISTSANPGLKLFISEWNARCIDWRGGLYAGGLLNAFEQDSDWVKMATPALWLRHVSAPSWDNAFINFDHRTWFPAPSYVVMKLYRDHFAPQRLALVGEFGPLNAIATKSLDGKHVFVKIVNPSENSVVVRLESQGGFKPTHAGLQQVASDDLLAHNSLEQRDAVRVAAAKAELAGNTVGFTVPKWSVTVLELAE